MEKFVIGKPFACKHDFRETCFGICENENKVLLTKNIFKDETSLVGGGIENGESHKTCLEREFAEEVGYKIESISELCDVDCYWLAGGMWPLRSLAHFYVVKVGSTSFKPTEPGHQPLWTSLKDVKSLCPLPYQQKAIEYFLSLKK